MTVSDKPLRILVIVNLPWDSRLGAARVWMELAEQWRAAGHTVEKLSLSDAFPRAHGSAVSFALRQLAFIRKAAAYVRQHGDRFDVVDALIGTLPFSRSELGFHGVIIARSVGLYYLYDKFDETVEQRWPRPKEGKLTGRLLYGYARRRQRRAAERSVRAADVINVPNEAEATCLRNEIGIDRPIIVEPYGFTDARRQALAAAASPAEVRLAEKRICFIGMWGPRKGAYDWASIIERVRAEVPEAKFKFLGTMVDEEIVRRELGSAASADIELISDYQPDELPSLLANCTVGAFPSYVEGFGLAVIEQLAAGLPTVAYDTPGPRGILEPELPEMLIPSGDVAAFASALTRLLRFSPDEYRDLSTRGATAVADLSWRDIAAQTLQAYRALLEKKAKPIVFVQPFSLGSAGGGARILRALIEQAPLAVQSVCSSPEKPKAWRDEVHLPSRPSWGRIEHSRLAALPMATAGFFTSRFRRQLKQRCVALEARAIHSVPHAGLDFAEAHAAARELSLPFFISLHDDLAYTAGGRANPEKRERAIRDAWLAAAGRFVISEALGREYCRRYGEQPFQVVTDGLTNVRPVRTQASNGNGLRIYFMGLFHMAYEANLRAFLHGIEILGRNGSSKSTSMTLRCEHVRPEVIAGAKNVTILPFADEAQVQRDIEDADLLYMPIPFGDEHRGFARYSLSTKMVTYVGSGVPILYHGPHDSAAYELLSQHRAAVTITSLEPDTVAAALMESNAKLRTEVAANARALAERDFMLADQTRTFWGTISAALTND